MKSKKINRKKRNQTIKYKGGSKEKIIQDKLLSFLNNIKGNNVCKNSSNDINNCKIPNSKSDQMIRICENSVFKGPRSNYKHKIKVFDTHIKVDSHTMNILVQTAIKSLGNNNIEQYKRICNADGYSYALEGLAFRLPIKIKCESDKCERIAHSVEDYIEIINDDIEQIIDSQKLNNMIKKQSLLLLKWIKSIIESLDFLFEKIQFHHCDPKAAQLFLNNDNVIVGDLDKVTFTMKIGEIPYRICLGSGLSNIAANIRGSEPERMRYETEPRQSNLYEKACFITSILLLLNDKLRLTLMGYIANDNKISYIINFILLNKLNELSEKPFSEKTGHRVASECVNLHSKQLNSVFEI